MDPKSIIDRSLFINSDGTLKIKRFALNEGYDAASSKQFLSVDLGLLPSEMAFSPATGESMVSNGLLGADIIRLGAGTGFVPHTHPGDHLLIIIGGKGTITYGGKIYPTEAGQIYMVEGEVAHAVGAITDHVIMAVGAPHKPVDSTSRMTPTEYEAVTTDIKELHCLICDIKAKMPSRLHDVNCRHCPCMECNPFK